jgi:hypothetical protein
VTLNFNHPLIGADSVVTIAASEYRPNSSALNQQRIVGDATVSVANVAPHGPPFDNNGGVTFVVVVDFPQPIFHLYRYHGVRQPT